MYVIPALATTESCTLPALLHLAMLDLIISIIETGFVLMLITSLISIDCCPDLSKIESSG